MSAPRVSSHTPGTAVARSSSGRVPGIWLATSARGSALGGSGCAGTAPAAPHSASNTSNLLAIMNELPLLVGGIGPTPPAEVRLRAARDRQGSLARALPGHGRPRFRRVSRADDVARAAL